MEYDFGEFGNHPQTRQLCERALKLHHSQQSGPLPYATMLAIAAMSNCSIKPEPISEADAEAKVKKQKNG